MKSDANQLLTSEFVWSYSKRQENDKQGESKMKYEMIFGDEKLFDGCDENAIAVVDDMTGGT